MKTCPICGSRRIARVTRTLVREAGGRRYKVPGVAFHECGSCGEKFFDRAASRKIDQHSPVLSRKSRRQTA